MRVLAPAKINLHLRVGARRDDGFHPLLSWMCTVGLFDILDFKRARRPGENSAGFVLSCDRADLGETQSNLIVRAATALAEFKSRKPEETNASVGGISAVLNKQIPVGAGLGGGSSDGARTLLALNHLLSLDLPLATLHSLAAKLGSDCPFFLYQPSAICTGRGEIVTPVAPPKARWCVLILPPYSIATPPCYRQFDAIVDADPALQKAHNDAIALEPDWNRWSQLSADQLLPLLINDLERPAFELKRELGALRAESEQALGRIVRMSGSGSSLFTLFDSEKESIAAAQKLGSRFQVKAISVQLAPLIGDDLDADR